MINLRAKIQSSVLPQKKPPAENEQNPEKKIDKNFSLHFNKDLHSYEKEKVKSQRRRVFNDKVQKIPVNISEEKKLKILVSIDKSMNPLKYQIMGRKGFSDEEIYH